MANLAKRVQTIVVHSHAHNKDHHGKEHHGNQYSPFAAHHDQPLYESYRELSHEQQAAIAEGKTIIPVVPFIINLVLIESETCYLCVLDASKIDTRHSKHTYRHN